MPIKILIVDGQQEGLDALKALILQEPTLVRIVPQIFTAGTVEEGIAAFTEELPDLVLTDLALSDVDGRSFCHQLRYLQDGGDVPLMAIYAAEDTSLAEQLEHELDVEILSKPVDFSSFAEKIHEVLGRYIAMHPERAEEWAPSGTNEHHKPALSFTPEALQQPLRGKLTQYPLAWLLVQMAATESTGSLKLARGKVRKVIYIKEGSPIFVDSNLRNETLGAYLVSREVIDEAGLAQALKQARTTGRKLGETLIELELVDEEGVIKGLNGQTRLKIASALRWPDGAFAWLPGDNFSDRVPNCNVEPLELVLTALRSLINWEELSNVLTPQMNLSLQFTELGLRYLPVIDQVFGSDILTRALSGISLQRALESDQDLPTLLIAVATLRLTGLAEFVQPTLEELPSPDPADPLQAKAIPKELEDQQTRNEFLDEAPTRPRMDGPLPPLAPRAPSTPPLSAAPASSAPQAPAISPLDSQERHLIELRDLEPTSSPTEETELEHEVISAASMKPPLHAEPEDSGVVSLSEIPTIQVDITTLPPQASPPPSPISDAAKLREVLLQTYLGIHDKDFYQILEVSSHASPQEIEAAYRKALDRFSFDQFKNVDLGDEDSRLEELKTLASKAFGVLSDPAQRQSYDQELQSSQDQQEQQQELEPDAFGAEIYFQEGQTQLRQKEFTKAAEAFSQAVQANPDQPDYHAYLGWALFLNHGRGEAGALAARPHLGKAFHIAPDSIQAHELAGRIERDAKNLKQATHHLIQAFSLGAPRMDLFDTIKDLLKQQHDYQELEQQIRNLIFRLREKDPIRTVPLWIDLAYLYLNHLGKLEDAKVSLQVAQKLSPDAPQVQAALNTFGDHTAQNWHPIAEGYRQRLRANPEELSPLHRLFAIHQTGGRPDHALVAATILAHHEAATPEEQALHKQRAPGTLIRAPRPLEHSALREIRGDESQDIVLQMMACLSPLLSSFSPVSLEDLGSSEEDHLIEIAWPYPFSSVFKYVRQQLGVTPRLYSSSSLGLDMIPFPGSEEACIVGNTLVDSDDEALIAFCAARALSCVDPGRRHLFSRRIVDLKGPIIATLAHFRESFSPPDADGSQAAFQVALKESSTDLEPLNLIVQQLFTSTKINLSEWRRIVRRVSARVGLIVSADLGTALRAVDSESHVFNDLINFALGETYAKLRV